MPATVPLGCISTLNMLNLGLQLPLSCRETDGDTSQILSFHNRFILQGIWTPSTEKSCLQGSARRTSGNRDRVKTAFLAFCLTFTGLLTHWWVACSVPSRLGSTKRLRNQGGQLSASMTDSFGDAIIYIRITGSGQVRSLPTTCSQEDDVFACEAYI